MQTRPTQVYLDNSDLSNLFKRGSAQTQRIRDELLELKELGSAEFFFSVWHVIEFIQPPPPEYIEEHRAKAKFLYELCGANALPHFSDLLDESEPLIGKSIWFPQAAIAKISFDLKQLYRDQVNKLDGLNRQQRRALRLSAAFKIARSAARNLESSITDELPTTEEFLKGQYLTKVIRGDISEATFARKLAELFSHPPIFYQEWYLKGTKPRLLHDLAKSMEDDLYVLIEKFRDGYEKLIAIEEQRRSAKRQFLELGKRIKALGIEVPPHLEEERRKIEREKIKTSKVLQDIQAPPRLAYIKHYIDHVMRNKQFKRSDLGDLMHLFYAPDVDLIRVDARMFEIMKNNTYFDSNKMVRTLDELPSRIKIHQLR